MIDPAAGDACRPTRTATTRRWRRSAPGSTRSSPTRRPPRRSSPGTASCASGRASTTSTCRPTTEPNVHLVDTDGKGVERIDETGVWVGGVHYELDCLIFASASRSAPTYARRAGFETDRPRRRDAVGEYWAEGMRSLHGIHVHGFPNLFIVGPEPGRQPDLEHHPQPHRGRHHHRRRRRARARDRRRRGRGHRGGRGGLGRRCWRAARGRSSATPTARPATTTTRAGRSAAGSGSTAAATPTGPVAYFELHRRVAQLGRVRGPRVPHP